MFLGVEWHVGYADDAAHKRHPRLFRHRLKVGKIPELPFVHLDLSDLVVEDPGSEHGETALLGVAKHRIRQSLPHKSIPFAAEKTDFDILDERLAATARS